MEILYTINNRRVEKAVFRTFSSQCEKWVNIIAEKEMIVESWQGRINLIYYPAWNIVVPICKPAFLISTLLNPDPKAHISGVEKILNTIKHKLHSLKSTHTHSHSLKTLEKV